MGRQKKSLYWRQTGRYLVLSSLMVCTLSLSQAQSSVVSKNWNPAKNWDVEDAHSLLYVHGVLTESACRLDMSSAWQDIDLHNIGTGSLRTVGVGGDPIPFELRLADCVDTGIGLPDVHQGRRLQSSGQPIVRVSFHSERDPDMPQWVKVNGAAGVGLRFLDYRGQDVRLGEEGQPLQLEPGENIIRYSVTPMRTTAPLNSGVYHAVVSFHLSYE